MAARLVTPAVREGGYRLNGGIGPQMQETTSLKGGYRRRGRLRPAQPWPIDHYERQLHAEGFRLVAGVDEVGRVVPYVAGTSMITGASWFTGSRSTW